MKYILSKKVEQLVPSGIRKFFDLVLDMEDVISLGVGEPDFMTPWCVREKAIDSIERGHTSYTSNKGMPELRRCITKFLKKRYELNYDFEKETLITVGVSEGLDLVMRVILNSGDKVLIPEPAYVSYGPVVELAGGKVVTLKTEGNNGFKLMPEQVDRASVKGVKALMINYPCNPTGSSYTRTELEALAKVIKKRNLIVISDEVYDELTYDFDHVPFSSLEGMKEHVVYLNGFSKTYAMTGFRIGWVCGPEEIISAMTKVHQYTILCPTITGQISAIEAIRSGQKDVLVMKKEYAIRRNYIVKALNDIGLDCHKPQGAFYVFPSVKNIGITAMDFAKGLLQEQKVAVVPGGAFGSDWDSYVRISYASSYENLKESVKRIAKFINNVRRQ